MLAQMFFLPSQQWKHKEHCTDMCRHQLFISNNSCFWSFLISLTHQNQVVAVTYPPMEWHMLFLGKKLKTYFKSVQSTLSVSFLSREEPSKNTRTWKVYCTAVIIRVSRQGTSRAEFFCQPLKEIGIPDDKHFFKSSLLCISTCPADTLQSQLVWPEGITYKTW